MLNPSFESYENFRDLACYPCRYGKMQEGVIYRSGSPSYGSPKDLEILRSLGIKTIIDLRGSRIINKYPHPFREDPEIKVIPLEVPNGYHFPESEAHVPLVYLSFLCDPYYIRRFVHEVVTCPKPLLIHCEAGKDRTGTMSALIELANGVSREDVCADYNKSYDGRLANTEKATRETYPEMQDFVFHMNPNTFGKFVDGFFEKYGSFETFFEVMGVPEDEANAFSNIFGVQERSAGAVVFHGNKVLVEHMQLGHYSMPKGHVEESDGSLLETALREIKEETGLDAKILGGFETSSVYSPKPGHIKRVTWFIATVDSEDVKPQPEEIERIVFVSPADAIRILSHDDDRRVLGEACAVYFQE